MSRPANDDEEEDVEIAPGVTKEDIYPFIYDKTYPFVFCSLCQSGILVSSAHTHLQCMHKEVVTKEQRNRATYTLTLLPGIPERDGAQQLPETSFCAQSDTVSRDAQDGRVEMQPVQLCMPQCEDDASTLSGAAQAT